MNVKNILKIACEYVENKDLLEEIDGTLTTAQQAQLNQLLKCLNWVHEEISTEYFPLYNKESVNADEFLSYDELDKDVCFVKSISLSGVKKEFSVYPDGVCFEGKIDEIIYSYIPSLLILTDEFFSFIPERVYAFGVAREYFLQQGITDKSIFYNSRFYDSIQNFVRSNSVFCKNMPARKWF